MWSVAWKYALSQETPSLSGAEGLGFEPQTAREKYAVILDKSGQLVT
jgi:hypothetical protein